MVSSSWPSLSSILPQSILSKPSKILFLGLVLGFTFSLSSTSFALYIQDRNRRHVNRKRLKKGQVADPDEEIIHIRGTDIVEGVTGLIGNTPLMRITSLSEMFDCDILGKAEFLSPGGSPKDRVALNLVKTAEQSGLLHPNTGSRIFEGTMGSTGISLAMVGKAMGYDVKIVMPDDVATEKSRAIEVLGGIVQKVRPASIVDPAQFVNLARQQALEFGQESITPRPPTTSTPPHSSTSSLSALATPHPNNNIKSEFNPTAEQLPVVTSASNEKGEKEVKFDVREEEMLIGDGKDIVLTGGVDWRQGTDARGFFADQFESPHNFAAHYHGTGPEIWTQTKGRIDSFVCGSGTGGTISGVGRYLKNKDKDIRVGLADPEGSGLFNKIKYGVMYDPKESEGKKRRHQVDTVVEGIGLNRLTHNFSLGLPIISTSYRVTDAEAVAMARFLVKTDGLFIGSSSAVNLVAAVREVQALKELDKKKMHGLNWQSESGGVVRDIGEKLGVTERKVVVTVLCDSGVRGMSKFWSDEYLKAHGIPISDNIDFLL